MVTWDLGFILHIGAFICALYMHVILYEIFGDPATDASQKITVSKPK